MKILVRVLFLAAALAGAFVLARQQKLLRPIVRFFKPAVPLGEYRDPTAEAIRGYQADLRALLDQKDYAALNAAADQALTSKERFSNGLWKVARFYDAFGASDQEPDTVWNARLQQLNGWLIATPRHVAPYVAIGEFYTNFAWKARGSDWASKVTQDGWRLFRERLGAANAILDRALTLGNQNPAYWTTRHIVARGLDWPTFQTNAIFAAGVKAEPQYEELYIAHAMAILPRWGGQPGEMEQFALAATKVPGGLGEEIYARIVFAMDDMHGDVFKRTKLDWSLANNGCKVLMEKYPDEPSIISEYAKIACRIGDTSRARQLFEELDDRVDLRLWESAENYRKHYNHVFPESKK